MREWEQRERDREREVRERERARDSKNRQRIRDNKNWSWDKIRAVLLVIILLEDALEVKMWMPL